MTNVPISSKHRSDDVPVTVGRWIFLVNCIVRGTFLFLLLLVYAFVWLYYLMVTINTFWVELSWVELSWVKPTIHVNFEVWRISLQWRHNERDGVSNHQAHDCLLNRLFRSRSKKTSKLRVTGLCVGNSAVTGEFPAYRVSNAENFPFDDVIMWHELILFHFIQLTIILERLTRQWENEHIP